MPAYELPSPESIPALYRKHGMRPMQGRYVCDAVDDPPELANCLCPMVLIAVDAGHGDPEGDWGTSWFDKQFGSAFRLGMGDGFDENPPDSEHANNELRYAAGYEFGKTAWQACVSAGLTGESE